MHSSTSDSKSRAMTYAKALAGICAILIIAIEIFSGYLLKRHSVTYARISRQYDAAVKIRPAGPGEPASVLMVGNSLLLHGVEMDRLRALTFNSILINPIFLAPTVYHACISTLQRLFPQTPQPPAL